VKVPLQPSSFFVLRRDETLARSLELFQPSLELAREPNVPEHQPHLGSEVGEKLRLCRREGLARRLGHGDAA
jgi:hypothetical protein